MDRLLTALTAVVAGDISHLDTIMLAPHSRVQDAASALTPLILTKSALERVIAGWIAGQCNANDVQRWSSFVRRGYVSGQPVGDFLPINIDYDVNDEDIIAEVISRLDEIGDPIDGFIDVDEQNQLLQLLIGN